MGRACRACKHSLEGKLHEQFLAGVSFRYLALAFGLSQSAIFRHEKNHHFEKKRGIPVIHVAPKPYPVFPAPRRGPSPPATTPPEGGVVGRWQREFMAKLLRAHRR